MAIRTLDLFSGIGGISLGLERTGFFKTVGFCEIAAFPRTILAAHWPGVWIHDDIKTINAATIRLHAGEIDFITGGVPCQPASLVGHRKGAEDDRWLWPDFLRVVREIRPRAVLAENVPGLLSLQPVGIDWIVGEMEAQGYSVLTFSLGAEDVGYPHKRHRVWILGLLGDPDQWALEGCRFDARNGEALDSETGQSHGAGRVAAVSEPRRGQHHWEAQRIVAVKCPVGGSTHGLPKDVAATRREQMRAIGNAVVPETAYQIGLVLHSMWGSE